MNRDELAEWLTEEDDLVYLIKLLVLTFVLMILLLTLPIWAIPYLIYKKVSER